MAKSKQASKQQQVATMLKQQPHYQQAQYQVPYGLAHTGHHYAPPYLAGAPPSVHNLANGAQTISRSSDLHKQFAYLHHNPTMASRSPQQVVQQQQLYPTYEQPGYLGQHNLHPYGGGGAMSLAVRAPRERASLSMLPYGLAGGATTMNPATSRHYLQQLYLQQQQQQVAHLGAPGQLVGQAPAHQAQGKSRTSAANLEGGLALARLQQARLNKPLCRCRVMYLGSSVPHITKNGLHGIQEPLKHLYPEEKFNTNSLRRRSREASTIDISHLSSHLGIDSWLSVWSNGLLLENVDEFGREIKRFFGIESLHYCAAVRFFDTTALAVIEDQQQQQHHKPPQVLPTGGADPNNNQEDEQAGQGSPGEQQQSQPNGLGPEQTREWPAEATPPRAEPKRGVVRFLPLDAPIFQCPGMLDANHPPVFASIMRRTTGVKVLECHAFICRRDAAANALVRCCTHAYADFLSAKRLSAELGPAGSLVAAQQKHLNGSSYYTGAESTTTGGGGQRRRSRSSSSGPRGLRRASNSSQRTGADGGPYQVVEAAITHHHHHQAVARQKPSQSLSTGGTNSQEMTHSDENSLESEDNYAIISRQQQQASNQQTGSSRTTYQQMRGSRSRRLAREANSSRASARRHRRRVKGSSKSLFDDFQPHELERRQSRATSEQQRHHDELDRLSHSLDHLQLAAATCCPAWVPAHAQPHTDAAESSGEQIKYSIVSGKQKRYSKSMQQLQQMYQTPGGLLGSGPPQPAPPPPPPLPPADFEPASASRRKAASCQDILAAGSLSRGSSRRESHAHSSSARRGPHGQSTAQLRRRSSQSSTRRSSMSSLQNSCSSSLGGGGSHTLTHANRKQARPSRPGASRKYSVEAAAANQSSIYATCEDVDEPAGGQRILRPDCFQQPPPASLPNSSTAGKSRSKSHHARRHPAEHQPIEHQQQQQLANHLHLAQLGFCPPALPPPPPPLPAAAHHGGAYSPQPHPLYAGPPYYLAGPTLYESPYLAPAVMYHPQQYHAHPQQQQQHHHPMFQQASISARHAPAGPPAHLAHQYQHGPATLGRTSRPPSSVALATGQAPPPGKELKSKSQTLATRFRCLSPPVNFFHGPAGSRPEEAQAQQQPQQQHAGADYSHAGGALPADNRQSITSAASNANSGSTLTSELRISPGQVVSGRPGFLAGSSSSTTSKRPASKLSWIKRLSLTLSAGSRQACERPAELPALAPSPPAGDTPTACQPPDEPDASETARGEGGARSPSPPMNGRREEPAGELAAENNGQSLLSDQAQEVAANQQQQVEQQPARGEPGGEPDEQPRQEQIELNEETNNAKAKRKRTGGLFSGTLTLGRSSKAKAAQARPVQSATKPSK